jgi:hypothetical protein|eukprot:SAG25_NODE_88_length_16343_cov_89.495383_13_plen_85_part_00
MSRVALRELLEAMPLLTPSNLHGQLECLERLESSADKIGQVKQTNLSHQAGVVKNEICAVSVLAAVAHRKLKIFWGIKHCGGRV